MSILFTPRTIGNVLVKNRFVHSACEDNLADKTGAVTEANIRRVRSLARGEVGLIIWTHLAVHPHGRTKMRQAGIFHDDMIPGLKKVVDAVHNEGGKIAFQLGHAGLQTSKEVIGRTPLGSNTMTEDDIQGTVAAFAQAAVRAVEAGADAIQFHAAHGYLINQFMSPFYNRRPDEWGQTDKNRFRFMKEIVLETKKRIPGDVPLLVKLNADDHLAREGIIPPLAATYAKWLAKIGIDGLEVSCGSSFRSPWAICRGEVPHDEVIQIAPASKKDAMEAWLRTTIGDYNFKEAYNLEAAKLIKSDIRKDISVFAVGGWRDVSKMEQAVQNGETDFISMCRPLIRDPHLVRRIRTGTKKALTCTNCNRCFAAITGDIPVRCYSKGISRKYKNP